MKTVNTTRWLLSRAGALARRGLRGLDRFLWEWTTNGNKRHRVPPEYRQPAPARGER